MAIRSVNLFLDPRQFLFCRKKPHARCSGGTLRYPSSTQAAFKRSKTSSSVVWAKKL